MYLSDYEFALTVRFDKQFANDFLALQLLICLDMENNCWLSENPYNNKITRKMRTILDFVSLFTIHYYMKMIFFYLFRLFWRARTELSVITLSLVKMHISIYSFFIDGRQPRATFKDCGVTEVIHIGSHVYEYQYFDVVLGREKTSLLLMELYYYQFVSRKYLREKYI